jgi:hypothetical protein
MKPLIVICRQTGFQTATVLQMQITRALLTFFKVGVALRKGGNGQAGDIGLSDRVIEEDAAWAVEYHYQHRQEPDADGRLASALRERLRNKRNVPPEHLETESARVMDAVLRV